MHLSGVSRDVLTLQDGGKEVEETGVDGELAAPVVAPAPVARKIDFKLICAACFPGETDTR